MIDAPTFWRHVNKDNDGGCWLWTGGAKGQGNYGCAWWNGRQWLAHRLAYTLLCGSIPTGLYVLHVCDVPRCVNPDHLRLGTPRDNMQDACCKGRQARGERQGHAILAARQVAAMRQRYAQGDVSQSQLAREYGIAPSHVWQIVNRRMWKHLP